MSINSEALTLAISRRLAIADNRNQQQAMIQIIGLVFVLGKNFSHSRYEARLNPNAKANKLNTKADWRGNREPEQAAI